MRDVYDDTIVQGKCPEGKLCADTEPNFRLSFERTGELSVTESLVSSEVYARQCFADHAAIRAGASGIVCRGFDDYLQFRTASERYELAGAVSVDIRYVADI